MFDEKTKTLTKVVARPEIETKLSSLPPDKLLGAIEMSFCAYSNQSAIVPPVGTLTFDSPPGDVHIKYGYIRDQEYYVIKIASGFYDNPELGLSSSNGLNLVFSQKTGQLQTILLDEGLLTDVRTALAGAVTAKHLAPTQIHQIGIVGTGIQARMQLQHILHVTDCRSVRVWGRNTDAARIYKKEMEAHGLDISVADHTDELVGACELIVCTTPSTAPLLNVPDGSRDQLIIAMGADTVGKQELSFDTLTNARLIALDSAAQCKAHGEIHKVWNEDLLGTHHLREIGDIILDKDFVRPEGLIVADLTGIATQDIMISTLVLE